MYFIKNHSPYSTNAFKDCNSGPFSLQLFKQFYFVFTRKFSKKSLAPMSF
jgi:hypothetical protein